MDLNDMRSALSEIAVENKFCAEQQNLTLNKNIVNLVNHTDGKDECCEAVQQANRAYRSGFTITDTKCHCFIQTTTGDAVGHCIFRQL